MAVKVSHGRSPDSWYVPVDSSDSRLLLSISRKTMKDLVNVTLQYRLEKEFTQMCLFWSGHRPLALLLERE